MLLKAYFTSVWLLLIALAHVKAVNQGETDRILANIMPNYKKDVHPNVPSGGAISIRMSMIPISITLKEEESSMDTHCWLMLSWREDRFKWNPRDYGNVSMVHISPDKVWKPDVRAFNAISHEDYESTDVLCSASGNCWWFPPTNFHTSCMLDYTYWPWDRQYCRVVMGSWTKTGDEVDVSNVNGANVTKVDLTNFRPNVWQVESAFSMKRVKYYSGIDVPWPDVTIKLRLRRESFIDQKVAVLPLVVSACLTLAVFWTFPMAKSRLLLGCLNLITLTLMLLYLRSRLPMAGGQLPLVVSLTGSLTVLVTIQMLIAIAVTNLVARKDNPPDFLLTPLEGILGKVLCLSDTPLFGQIPSIGSYTIDMEALQIASAKRDNASVTSSTASILGNRLENSGWNLLAQAIDRILFLIYFLVIIIFIGAYVGGATSTD